MNILIVYGSTYGNTEEAAHRIADAFEGAPGSSLATADPTAVRTRIADVHRLVEADLEGAELVVIGASTWDFGQLQADWDTRLVDVLCFDWSGRRVALFGQGDQLTYEDTYLDAVGTIADRLESRGARLFGAWPADGYRCSSSLALRGDHFVGLALDEDNEADRTPGRIDAWVVNLAAAVAADMLAAAAARPEALHQTGMLPTMDSDEARARAVRHTESAA